MRLHGRIVAVALVAQIEDEAGSRRLQLRHQRGVVVEGTEV